jgi:hypothetical protein
MKNILAFTLILLTVLIWYSSVFPWDLTSKGNGISFGNSKRINGLRFNLKTDKNVTKINGFNFSIGGYEKDNPDYVTNGISIGGGIIAKRVNGFALGLVIRGDRMNGIGCGALAFGSKVINGIALAGVGVGSYVGFDLGTQRINGISVAGFSVDTDTIIGIALGGVGVGASIIQGVEIGGIAATSERLEGGAIGGIIVWAKNIKGFSIGGFCKTEKTAGVSIALYNRCSQLKGVQIGILNFAGNNRKPFRWLPFFNLHY